MTCAVYGFPESAAAAGRLAGELGISCRDVELRHFPDGESLVRIEAVSSTAILYRSLDRPNEKIVDLLLAASALRDNGVDRLVLVLPYLAYMRQDVAFRPGEAVSQRVIGRLLAGCCDAVLTVDAHLHRTPSLATVMPGIEAANVRAAPALAAALAATGAPLLVGPDGEARQWVEAVARPLGVDFLLGEKRRLGDREVELVIPDVERAAGRVVVLVDDLISSGATIATAARLLRRAGAARIEALATHCLAGETELEGLRREGICAVRSTDSVPGPAATIPVASLLAEEIRRRGWLNKRGSDA